MALARVVKHWTTTDTTRVHHLQCREWWSNTGSRTHPTLCRLTKVHSKLYSSFPQTPCPSKKYCHSQKSVQSMKLTQRSLIRRLQPILMVMHPLYLRKITRARIYLWRLYLHGNMMAYVRIGSHQKATRRRCVNFGVVICVEKFTYSTMRMRRMLHGGK